MTLINSVNERNVFYHENKSPQKNASLKIVKLNTHEIGKIFSMLKGNTQCSSDIKFLNDVEE